jgi:hypothetical protein
MTEVDQNTSCRCEYGPLWRCDVHGMGAPKQQVSPAPRRPAERVMLWDLITVAWRLVWCVPLYLVKGLLIAVVFCGWGLTTANEVKEALE